MAGSGGGGGGWRDSFRGMSYDNIKGLVLAISSSLFIGASFIVEKGLKKAATTGTRVGQVLVAILIFTSLFEDRHDNQRIFFLGQC